MKKAFFLHRESPLQMQNLDTFEAMSAVTLQFLQINAQCQAGATRTVNSRRGPDDMEIDALSKKGESKGKSKEKNSLDEIAIPSESVTTQSAAPSVGPSASQFFRTTQDTDTWDRRILMDEDEDGMNPAQRTVPPLQSSVCCARIGGQLC